MSSPENIHVVANLFGMQKAGQKRLDRFAARLKELYDSKYGSRVASIDDIIATSILPGEVAKHLDDRVKPHDAIVLLMGDGSLKNVAQDILWHSTNPDVKRANLLALDGGFACDTHRELHPNRQRRSPSEILDGGQVIQFHPQEWTFSHDGQSQKQVGMSYGTFGLSALMALTVNQPDIRERTGDNMLKKTLACLPAARRAGTFDVLYAGDRNPRQMYDMGYANGSNMGGNTDTFPTRLQDASMFHYEIESPGFISAAVKAATRSLEGSIVTGRQEFELIDDTVGQIDGEAVVWEALTRVSVGHTAEALTFYTSRAAA